MSNDICVFAGSRSGARGDYAAAAVELGRVLARRGHGIVYGGGRIGLMGLLADAGLEHGARVTGVIPRALASREVAHAGLSELFVVGTMHERKAKMAALSRAFIALPGGYGTLEELAEVVTWVQLGIHRNPVGLLDVAGFWQPYLALLDHFAREGFVNAEERKLVIHDTDAERLVERLTELSV
ncbi:MAG TPA: TIGR00730 family Rossman fold protein, partial [Polyangiaceae bacterium]